MLVMKRMDTTRSATTPLFIILALGCACSADTADSTANESDLTIWEPISTIVGNSPNFTQLSNGNLMSVVSRDFGRGAKAGALVELFYPKYAADNLWDSYVGVATGGKFVWAHDLTLKAQRALPGSGIVESDFVGTGFALRVADVMREKSDAHLRRVTVTNTGAVAITPEVAFFAFYTIDNLPGGDRVRYDASSRSFIQTDEGSNTVIATTADIAPKATHCGVANSPLGNQRDARLAIEAQQLVPCTNAGPFVGGVTSGSTYALASIAPGASASVTFAIGLGQTEVSAVAAATKGAEVGFDTAASEDRARWAAKLAEQTPLAKLPARAKPVYDRAIITLLQHRVNNGAFIAAPTLTSPVYRFVWPRDGSKSAVDLLEAGYPKEAAQFFEFLETQLLPDGSFAVNYFPDGSRPLWNFGAKGNENDQPGVLAWGVEHVYQVTQDKNWLNARYAGVRRTSEHLLQITTNGRIAPSRDLWELETGASWTYAQGSAIAGLEASSRIAATLGRTDDSKRYADRAKQCRAALDGQFMTRDGYFGRGVLRSGRVDVRVEIANLALGRGGFAILPDTDRGIAGVGDRVFSTLLTPGGGIRRYENDRYYGGQPWPVASNWMSMHKLGRGDAQGAKDLFQVITEQAYATESLMLGEQFDEKESKWLSAFPLAWSEATYLTTARALYQ
jgi:glucoamylase